MAVPIPVFNDLEDLQEFIRYSDQPYILVDVFATWCVPCMEFKPVFEQMQLENLDVLFAKVDFDEGEDIVDEYEVVKLPTFLIFEKGNINPVAKLYGPGNDAKRKMIEERLDLLRNPVDLDGDDDDF